MSKDFLLKLTLNLNEIWKVIILTLKCWSSSQVEKRFWSCMPMLKKITSPRPKKKKKKSPKQHWKKERPKAQNNLGVKIKIKHKASPMNKWSRQDRSQNYGQLRGQGTKKYSKTTKTLKKWLDPSKRYNTNPREQETNSFEQYMQKFNHIHISSPEIADATETDRPTLIEVAARKSSVGLFGRVFWVTVFSI